MRTVERNTKIRQNKIYKTLYITKESNLENEITKKF